MYGYIYKTTNLVTDKIYIGQHKGEFDRNYLGSGLLVGRAVRKYGRENFATILLAQAFDKKSLDMLERYYIAYYMRRLGRDMTYKLAEGGIGGETLTSSELRKKHRRSCRYALRFVKNGRKKGYREPLATRIKQRQSRLRYLAGHTHDRIGIPQTEFQKQRAREANLNTTIVSKNGINKRIHSADLNEHIARGWSKRMLTKRRTQNVLSLCEESLLKNAEK